MLLLSRSSVIISNDYMVVYFNFAVNWWVFVCSESVRRVRRKFVTLTLFLVSIALKYIAALCTRAVLSFAVSFPWIPPLFHFSRTL